MGDAGKEKYLAEAEGAGRGFQGRPVYFESTEGGFQTFGRDRGFLCVRIF